MRDSVSSSSALGSDIKKLIDNINNPERLRGIIRELSEKENFYNEAAPELARAVSTLTQNEQSIFDVTQGESGYINQAMSDVLGQSGIGQGLEKLQEGILSQIIRGIL
jgi:hypothetical protein